MKLEDSSVLPAGRLCKLLGKKKIIDHPICLWSHSLYVSIERRRGAKEPMIVVSNFTFGNSLGMYRRRWEIETMFGCLKTRGFRMEDTHITDADKIEKLLFVLAIAFCWAYRSGDLRAVKKPIEIKTHGRKAKSLFREGLDWIRGFVFGKGYIKEFRELLCFR